MLHLDYEICGSRSGGLRINFNHLGMFNVRWHLDTRTVPVLASIGKAIVAAGIKLTSFGLTTQRLRH